MTRIGGAQNCLLVYIDGSELVVVPHFPFTLMFLPELFGLDVRVPLVSVASVEPTRVLFSRVLRINFVAAEIGPIELRLHDEAGFLRHLAGSVTAEGKRKPAADIKPRQRLRFFRGFMALWGTGALLAALSGLPDDYLYRRDGVEITGVFDGHTGVSGARNDIGILSYSVEGQRYHLNSLQGSGVYEIGATAQLYYLPGKPENAREAAYLLFDLMWLGLAAVALLLAIFGGNLARRFS